MAMDRQDPDGARIGRKASFPIDALVGESDPFRLLVGKAELTDPGDGGRLRRRRVESCRWEPAAGGEGQDAIVARRCCGVDLAIANRRSSC